MGFPEHLVALLQSLYINQRACIRWNDDNTEFFQIGKGVRQGCIVSPHLFTAYTEQGMRNAEYEEFGVKLGGVKISNLRYADDTALIENSESNIINFTNKVNDAGVALNLRLNVKKTKLMVGEKESVKNYKIQIEGDCVEQVESFKYLGSLKSATADCTPDIKARIGNAKGKMMQLENIWKDRNLSTPLKLQILKALIWSVLLYGAEGWTLKKADENRINAAEMWLYRRLLRVSWKEKRTNESILQELGVERQLLSLVAKAKIGYYGHIARGSGSPLALLTIEGKVEGKRRRGRQRKQWFDNIKEWTNLEINRAKRLAQDRTTWKSATAVWCREVANRHE